MSQKSILKKAGLVSFFTLISRFAGLARDMAIAAAFGTQMTADAFFVAFRIPNLLRRLFAEGALTVSFVPVFTESLRRSQEEAKKVVSVTFTMMVVGLSVISLIGIISSPAIVSLTAFGFSKDPEKFALTVFLTRVMFPYILLVSLAAWAMGILNSVKHFGASAAAPIFMNLSIILGALVGTRYVQPPVLGLALGALLGGLLQFAIHLPFLKKNGFWPRWDWDPKHPAVKKIVGMMIPAAYGAAAYQFNVMALTFMASFLATGSNAYLWYADRIMEFPLGVFAISLSTVVLPSLAGFAADKDMEGLKKTFTDALRLIFFITIPAALGLITMAEPIVRMLFARGAFQEPSVIATSQALQFFAIGLPFISGVRITSNAFYSLQDSKSPVRAANIAVVANILFCVILMQFLQHRGLALSVALSALINFYIQISDFRKKVGGFGLRSITFSAFRTLMAASVMAGAVIWLHPVITTSIPAVSPITLHHIIAFLVTVLMAMSVFFLSATIFGCPEMNEVRRLIDRKILKRKR